MLSTLPRLPPLREHKACCKWDLPSGNASRPFQPRGCASLTPGASHPPPRPVPSGRSPLPLRLPPPGPGSLGGAQGVAPGAMRGESQRPFQGWGAQPRPATPGTHRDHPPHSPSRCAGGAGGASRPFPSGPHRALRLHGAAPGLPHPQAAARRPPDAPRAAGRSAGREGAAPPRTAAPAGWGAPAWGGVPALPPAARPYLAGRRSRRR